jgi:hypothetical protein
MLAAIHEVRKVSQQPVATVPGNVTHAPPSDGAPSVKEQLHPEARYVRKPYWLVSAKRIATAVAA